ncbi:hypothetical protein SS50377_20082 [Spironucleus salmonicida]|uniref:Uncharacterized protein n=1 Tax=Spironucleus salmonicida TaxID=348837 RepID=V6M7D6_9EUKA|nr:hypothetical protein SS50377_20082 [Spironucleus salmonicida]|eukprot:EST49349.1 Hypothetical protein SS50377_10274 [Spironucleus salmonicida]
MKKIAPSVVTFFLDAYKLVDCSVIFALYIQYFHQQNINFEFIDVEIVKQTALSNFFYCRIGLSFCLQFDLQVPINVLFDNLASMDYKIQILAMKICLISELIVFKSAISECYLQVRADYRVGNFDLLDIEIMMEKSGNFEDLNILID